VDEIKDNFCKILVFHTGVEDSGLLEYDVSSISKKFLTFQKITMPSSSELKSQKN